MGYAAWEVGQLANGARGIARPPPIAIVHHASSLQRAWRAGQKRVAQRQSCAEMLALGGEAAFGIMPFAID
jgi:hypothetical protein